MLTLCSVEPILIENDIRKLRVSSNINRRMTKGEEKKNVTNVSHISNYDYIHSKAVLCHERI